MRGGTHRRHHRCTTRSRPRPSRCGRRRAGFRSGSARPSSPREAVGAIRSVDIAAFDAGGVAGRPERIACDLLCVSGGWSPNVALFSQSGGSLRHDETLAAFVPDEARQAVVPVGACAGDFALSDAIFERRGGRARGGAQDGIRCRRNRSRSRPRSADGDAAPLPRHACLGASLEPPEIAHPRLRRSPERRHRQGSAPCRARGLWRGRACQALYHDGDGHRSGQRPWGINAIGGALGRSRPSRSAEDRRHHLPPALEADQLRCRVAGQTCRRAVPSAPATTPMHDWHVANGAVFEIVGDWLRARVYRQPGEDFAAALQRECRAAAQRHRCARCLHARQDRHTRQGCPRLPQPHLQQCLDETRAGSGGAVVMA